MASQQHTHQKKYWSPGEVKFRLEAVQLSAPGDVPLGMQ
jgi:hypothetical protein